MTVFCLGSINADYVYHVPHLPEPGETLKATSFEVGLGGKGCNQSIAAARAGARVVHIGAIGASDDWVIDLLTKDGINTDHIHRSEDKIGHAIINVDEVGENAIVIYEGANADQSKARINAALTQGKSGDILLLQNETTCQVEAAKIARAQGMDVYYSAAPFDLTAVEAVLPYATLLLMNEGENAQFEAEFTTRPARLITKGSKGAVWTDGKDTISVDAFNVKAVDTTAAGDCFAGYFAAQMDAGTDIKSAMRMAAAASALKVTRDGAASGIPALTDVKTYLKQH
ncbi:MAG: ribokinase [Halocynthiibacter sp.]